MEASSGKEAILKNIRKALVHSTDIPYPAIEKTEFSFNTPKEDLAVLFAEKFSSLLGKFSFMYQWSANRFICNRNRKWVDLSMV